MKKWLLISIFLPGTALASVSVNPIRVSSSTLPAGSTNYIQNQGTLQTGSTFYVSSGTANAFTAQTGTFSFVNVGSGTVNAFTADTGTFSFVNVTSGTVNSFTAKSATMSVVLITSGTAPNFGVGTLLTANRIILNGNSTTAMSVVGSTFVIDTQNGHVGIRIAPGATATSLQVGGSTLDGQISLGGTVSHISSLRSSGATMFGNNAWGKYAAGADNDIAYVKATTIGGASILKIGATGNQASPIAYYLKFPGVTVDEQLNVAANLRWSVDGSSTNIYGSTMAAISFLPDSGSNSFNTWSIQVASTNVDRTPGVPRMTIMYMSTNTIVTFVSTSTRIYNLVVVDTFTVQSSSLTVNISSSNIKARVGGCLFSVFNSSGNKGTTETDLYINSVASNSMVVNGDGMSASYGLNFIGHATATRQVKVYIASTTIFDSGTFTLAADGDGELTIRIVKSGTNSLRVTTKMLIPGASVTMFVDQADMGTDLLATFNLKVSGTAASVGAADNDIVVKQGMGFWNPSPN